jgi:hypothetical protein
VILKTSCVLLNHVHCSARGERSPDLPVYSRGDAADKTQTHSVEHKLRLLIASFSKDLRQQRHKRSSGDPLESYQYAFGPIEKYSPYLGNGV